MATAESCRTPDELRAQLAGPWTDAGRLALAAHLESCPHCRDAAETLLAEQGVASTSADGPHPRVTEVLRKLRDGARHAGGTVVSASEGDATLAGPPPTVAFPMPFSGPRPPGSTVAPPSQLAHFRIVKQLGAGGMGVVYLAEDTKLERRVAIKVMRPEVAAIPLQQERFLREAKATAKIQNDHIVTIYYVGEENGVPFLAMQLLQGESMESWLHRGQQPTPGQAVRLGRETAQGLAAAHSRGLIHRDIKPGNLWLEAPRGRVKILDFGLARATSGDKNLTSSGAIVGTPAYMAPEQARGLSVDARADLFSLGVVLFRLSTGRAPFRGGDAMTCMIAAATETPLIARELNPDIPEELCNLIAELLQKDPAHRPPSSEAVVDRLARIELDIRRNRAAAGASAGDSLAVEPGPKLTGSLPEASPPRRRKWLWPAAALVATVLAAGGVGVWFLTGTGTVEFKAAGEGLRVYVERDGKVLYTLDEPDGVSLQLRPGRYALSAGLKSGVPGTGVELTTDQGTNEIRVQRGGMVAVTVRPAERPAGADPGVAAGNPPDAALDAPVPQVLVRSAPSPALNSDVRSLAFVAGGRSLVVCYRSRVLTYNAADLRKTEVMLLHANRPDYKGGIVFTASSPDGKVLVVRTNAGKIIVWNTVTREEGESLGQSAGCRALEFSPDGGELAVGDGRAVRLLEGKTFKETGRLTGLPETVTALAYPPGGKQLAVGCVDGSLWLWDLATRKHEDISPVPRSSEVVALAFSPGGKRLAVGRPHDTKVLHVGPARELFTFRSQGGAVSFSHDGRWLAMSDARRVVLQDLTGRKRHGLPPEHSDVITKVAFAPDGRSLVTGGKDGTIRLWDVTPVVDGQNPLFNGRDLAGWKTYDAPADTFTVDNGNLVAGGKARGWLLTDADYADFDLRLEYRLTPGADSGIAVRAAPQNPANYALEVQIVDDDHFQAQGASGSFRPETRTGSIYNLLAPSVLNHNKVGDWNQLHLVVEGRRVAVDVNGLRVLDHEIDAADLAKRPELSRATGRIGLESREGRVEFRNLLAKRLRPAEKK
jgi:WD40 repeat protein